MSGLFFALRDSAIPIVARLRCATAIAPSFGISWLLDLLVVLRQKPQSPRHTEMRSTE